jgi:hypothetical protein
VPGDEPEEPGSNPPPEPARGDDDTVLPPSPADSPSPFAAALAQFADSIERLSAESATEMDPYTRGFVAGLRAAIQVAANVIRH